MTTKTWHFLPEFMKALEQQLKEDDLRWGDTWLLRTREGQTERNIVTFRDYFDKYEQVGTPINWLKIAGNALICWIRENHIGLFPK
jgi:hypothetical protein